MTPQQIAAVLAEYNRRNRKASLLEDAFDAQRAFLANPCRLKAALCTRRSGKSYGVGLYLVQGALERPGSSQLYVALTRQSAKNIMFKDVLKVIDRKYALGCKFNETTLEVTFPNGSMLYLLGVDAKPEEADKILGQKFYRAAVDECASFRQDLRHLVYAVIKPALADMQGTLALIGTPGNVKNFFHDVTTGLVPGWGVHKWSAFDNPHVAKQWQQEIDELLAANPGLAQVPLFRQHYYGEWTVDTSKLVYRFEPKTNELDDVPDLSVGEWRYVLGLDLGYNDPTAIVVGAYRTHDPILYFLHAEARKGLIVSQVADWVNAIRERFPIDTFVVDNASKQAVEELRQRHGLPLEAAEKAGKVDAIAMMSSDLITGRVKVVRPTCKPLVDEWSNLVWDERSLPKLVENPACPNHCADAALYAWRHAFNYGAKPADKRHAPNTDEYMEELADREAEEMEAEERRPFWER